jgi:hypothetical protein
MLSFGDNLACIFNLAVINLNNNALLFELAASPFGKLDLLAF